MQLEAQRIPGSVIDHTGAAAAAAAGVPDPALLARLAGEFFGALGRQSGGALADTGAALPSHEGLAPAGHAGRPRRIPGARPGHSPDAGDSRRAACGSTSTVPGTAGDAIGAGHRRYRRRDAVRVGPWLPRGPPVDRDPGVGVARGAGQPLRRGGATGGARHARRVVIRHSRSVSPAPTSAHRCSRASPRKLRCLARRRRRS